MEIPGYRVDGVLHQNARSTLYRGRSAQGVPVIIKTPAQDVPTAREIARYQWAHNQALEADSRAIVPHLGLVRFGASVALVSEDTGGVALASMVTPDGLPLARLLDLALALATALGRLHVSGIVHKDVKPANVIVSPDGCDLRFTDLDISTNLRREIADSISLDQVEGTLAYMSPEQCGRFSSPVDNRSDLYSLGIMLFELATGRLPFHYDSAAELAHAHAARRAPKLAQARPQLPVILSEMVDRLLAKNPDDRYANAQGLAHDLDCCVKDLRRTGTVRAFAIGQADAAATLRVPDRLYGRETDRERLLSALDAARHGKRSLITISGVSGIGKTALVKDAQPHIALVDGRVCAGKFDEFRSDLPYVGILQAAADLLRQELAEPEAQLALRRQALRDAVGVHGRLLTDGLPALATIIGPQPEVEAISPREGERRLHLLVGRFLAVFAVPAQPLFLFLDDLQWADPASLQLLEALAADPALDHLVIVGGYRSNEVGPGHPLRGTLDALRAASGVAVDIDLGPLRASDVQALLADMLHAAPADVQALAAHMQTVSAGNPFAVREFLHALRARGFFQYEETHRTWTWDLARLHEYALPDNVAALIAARLGELSPQCLDLLDTASCVGAEFDLHTLAHVHAMSLSAAAIGLAAAVRSGIVVPLDTQYKLFESLDGWNLDPAALVELGTARYRFQHDRVRLTVHDRLAQAQRAERHLRIGRLLLQGLSPEALSIRVVEVFSHVVFGIDLVHDAEERGRLARIGLTAGHSAQRALAFVSARRMLLAAAQLLPASGWTDDYETAIGIHSALAECAYALSLADEFEDGSDLVIRNAKTVVHRVQAHALRIRVRTAQNRYAEAVDIAVEVAASLGVALPRKPRLPHVLWGVVQALAAQGRRDAFEFDALPEATDAEIRAAVSLLASAASSAYFSEPNLLPLIGMTCTRLSLKHGTTPHSAYGYAVWALVLCGVLGRIDNGYRFGELALKTGRRYGGTEDARARFVVDTFVRHWKEPLPQVARVLYDDWAFNRDSGDEQSAVYCAGASLYTHWLAGGSLDVHDSHADAIRFLVDCGQPHVKYCLLAWVQLFAALREDEPPADLDGEWFRFAHHWPEFERTGNVVQMAMGGVPLGILDFLAGRFDRAEARFALCARLEDSLVGQTMHPGLVFFRALNLYRQHGAGSAARSALKTARRLRRRLERWAVHAPFNLDHRVSLLRAEEAMVDGDHAGAVLLLHRAFEQALGGGKLYQALAQQRLAHALDTQGMKASAATASLRAAELFRSWGSPWLGKAAEVNTVRTYNTTEAGTSHGLSELQGADMQSLMSAVAAISAEIDASSLLARLMPTLMQVAGADRGVLLLADSGGKLWVEAEADLEKITSTRTAIDAFPAISRRLVDLALRSADPVVVQDASAADMLQGEDYAKRSGVAAILAVSIALQGRTAGVLYLENHVARGAFNAGRVQITRALGAQTAISLENARLYGSVQAALGAQTLLTEANRRFVPGGFLAGLGCESIVDVSLNEAIEREMNVLFVDLRGFSALSAQLGPRGTVGMINRYLSHVQPGITAYGGFVGQYYGDGILALFPEQPDDALRGAIAMTRGLDAYNADRQAHQYPGLRFGMGLHSGPVILGTIGDPDHFQCAVIGDSVNLASRMEGLTKYFGATLVLSAATRDRLEQADQFALRPLGNVRVAGRAEAMDVFDCMNCYPEALQARIVANNALHAEGLERYRAGEWARAQQLFERCVAACEEDAVARGFAQRCGERAASGVAWDGVEIPGKGG
jgi:predicted ATPase/class 3 adenylate cyclase